MIKAKKLRVLLVEPSRDGAALTLGRLRECGYEVDHMQVVNAPAMEVALAEEKWDVVLCSDDPPGFCGLDALRIMQSREMDAPFIFLSENLHEETIVNAIKAGADDYVSRNSLNRLAPSIEKNLRLAGVHGERRRVQPALPESEVRLNAFVADLPGMAYQVLRKPDGSAGFPYVSEGSHAVLGLYPHELEKNPALFLDMLHPDDRASYTRTMETSARQLSFWNWEGRIRIPPGNEIKWINLRCSPRKADMGILWEGIMLNITQSKQAEIELSRSQEQLRELSSHIHDVREQERLAIAREVHDNLGSTLTAIKLDVAWLGGRLAAAQPELASKVKNIESLVDKCAAAATNISRTLRPSVLDEFGIVAAIEMEADEFQQRTGIVCTLEHNEEGAAPAPDIAIALFRIFQESLNNITKHARASKVTVDVINRPECINLVVSDNGCGCTEADRRKPHSFGLRGIQERIAHFGGEVRIVSAPGRGTTVAVCVPRQRQQAAEGGSHGARCPVLQEVGGGR